MEAVKDEMKRLEDERATHIAAGEPAGPPINEDEVWDRMAGGRKRGRIYGKGKVPKRPVPRLVDPEDASTCSGLDAREHITLLNREIHQHAEEYRREMEAWKQRYEIDQLHPTCTSVMPLPPPPPLSSLRHPRPPPVAAPSRTETHPDDGSSSDDEDYN
ncbi:hypothetical protein PIB30_058038 [Stylosanthes scabra]|uniref:Uncharacterized protein n=1 Tax=Stylosanthes scabra TaxID=79078 RepID=A0ABU6VMZ2_9FABA|nr:hypothetical protein [Stylosanthes scabra]